MEAGKLRRRYLRTPEPSVTRAETPSITDTVVTRVL